MRVAPTVLLMLAGISVAGCGSPTADPTGGVPPQTAGSTDSGNGESAGEGRRTTAAPDEPPQSADTADSAPPTTAAADVSVRVIDEKEFARVLESHRGSVVLVDFWAFWCIPCLKLFPHTVELHEKLAEQGLVVISVNLDDPEQLEQVREFLAAKGATFENFISQHGAGSRSFEAFGIESGNIPYFRLYDRSGRPRETFGDTQEPIDPDQIDEAVEELLAES